MEIAKLIEFVCHTEHQPDMTRWQMQSDTDAVTPRSLPSELIFDMNSTPIKMDVD